jgi:hypothetical protein
VDTAFNANLLVRFNTLNLPFSSLISNSPPSYHTYKAVSLSLILLIENIGSTALALGDLYSGSLVENSRTVIYVEVSVARGFRDATVGDVNW